MPLNSLLKVKKKKTLTKLLALGITKPVISTVIILQSTLLNCYLVSCQTQLILTKLRAFCVSETVFKTST